jgi:hypothetical protein
VHLVRRRTTRIPGRDSTRRASGMHTVITSGGASTTPHSQSAAVPPRALPGPACRTAAYALLSAGTGPVNVA